MLAEPLSLEWLLTRWRQAAPPTSAHVESATTDAVPAAVLIPLVAHPDGLTVVLTRRTAHLRDHAGQISFPGGRCEPEDGSTRITALRETHEEIGLPPTRVSILGSLPDYWTSTGYRVTPVVGWVRPPLELRPDAFEVAEVFEVPLAFLLDATRYRRECREHLGQQREFWAVPWREYYIWGATAGMLDCLRRQLVALP